jgi:hypothetical protein
VLGRIKSTARAHAVRIWESPPFAKNTKDGPPRIYASVKRCATRADVLKVKPPEKQTKAKPKS